MVRFLKRKSRQAFLQSAKERKITAKDVNTNFPEDPVYVNEHLTPERKILLGMAKKKKNELRWKFAWVKDGKIMMRKTERSKIVRINNEEDLRKIT